MIRHKTTIDDIMRAAAECDAACTAITLTMPISWPRPPGFPRGDLFHADGHGCSYAYDPARLLQWLRSLQKEQTRK